MRVYSSFKCSTHCFKLSKDGFTPNHKQTFGRELSELKFSNAQCDTLNVLDLVSLQLKMAAKDLAACFKSQRARAAMTLV